MNACNPQEPLSEAQIALNIKHYEYSQQFGANYLNRFESNMRECHDYQFQRQNELNQQIKHRCLNSVGPPPRPFKKARYAWEIKNYDYTVRRMSRPLVDDVIVEGPSQENRSEDQTPEICSSQSNETQENSSYNNEEILSNSVNEPRPEYVVGPVIPAAYPPNYGNFLGSEQNQRTAALAQGLIQNENPQQIRPVDPDARLIRWHTRQLCRSIFDNTVNRMLENMGFSPVTEASQGLHPLLVLNLSDDEEREAEEAHQRALETHALSAALHQKGLIPPPYQYDAIESATTSDYDSSEEEEESELGDIGGSEDLGCEAPQSILPEDPYMTFGPTSIPLGISTASLGTDKQDPSNLSTPTLANSCDMTCPTAQNLCDFQKDCETHLVSHPKVDQSLDPKVDQSLDPNCDAPECPHDTPTAQLKLDDNENCIAKSETLIEGKVEQVLDDGKTKTSENNNNDKFFIRNAIEMAIKQHGLGFQRA